MNRLIDGKPGLIVDRSCARVRKSLAGGYHFKRVAMGGGQERFKDAPNKNEHSHVGDAYGYLMMGSEHRNMTRNSHRSGATRPIQANMDFNVF